MGMGGGVTVGDARVVSGEEREDGRQEHMLSNGWYWSGMEYEVMAYPMDGWRIRCRWEELLNGRWALTMSVEEVTEDPAPWIPGGVPACHREVRIRPEVGGHRNWSRPDPRVMEELSRRAGEARMRQVVRCCRSRESLHRVYIPVKLILDRHAHRVI